MRLMRFMRKTPQTNGKNDTNSTSTCPDGSKKRPSRRRGGGCVASRERAVLPAVPTCWGEPAGSGADGPDGPAAGAGGARAAGRLAAAPEAGTRPVLGLPCVVAPLQELPRAPRHAAARPLRPGDGARRGGGAARPGGVRGVRPVQGALCVAAAAVPRLDGCFEGVGRRSCQPRKSQRLSSYNRSCLKFIQITSEPFFFTSSHLLKVHTHTHTHLHLLYLLVNDSCWTPVSLRKGALKELEIYANCSKTCNFASHRYLKFPWKNVVNCEWWMPIPSLHVLTSGHSYPESVKVLESFLWLLFWITGLCTEWSRPSVVLCHNVLRMCSGLISELK